MFFDDLSSDEKMEVRKDTEERYLSNVFWKSGKQHNTLKVFLQDEFNTCDEQYPKNRQGTLMILYKYTRYIVIQQTTSEVTSFAQRDDASNKQIPPYDEKYWKY